MNGTATCDGTACGITCNAGFVPVGSNCVSICSACDATATIVSPPGGRFTGTTSGASATTGSCGGGSAPEAIYKLVLGVTSDVFITTHGTGFNTVVYVRRDCCGGTEVGCNDNADGRTTSVLSLRGLTAGTYYVYVDGAAAGAMGAYTVDIYATAASGNNGEACGSPIRLANVALAGTNCGYINDLEPQVGCTVSGATGQDVIYYFVLDAPTSVQLNTCSSTCIDSVLYIRDVCTGAATQRTCNDDSCRASGTCYSNPAAVQSRTATVMLPAGAYYAVVDQFAPAPMGLPCGGYTISSTGIPP